MLAQSYQGRRVLITGHSGFKGSWLGLWLQNLGAQVYGYSLPPSTTPSHFSLLDSSGYAGSCFGDIADAGALERALLEWEPEVVFHLAAQPLVRHGYKDPAYTFEVNALGTLSLLNLARKLNALRAIVIITTDKVYENREWIYGYREVDALGGHDPYSASKACAEIITDSMRRSFFDPSGYGSAHRVLIATARAGNVIGGGDWSDDRLIPDCMRAVASATPAPIRHPEATRPWQHVFEPLRGYLMLGARLLAGDRECATSFNFGPAEEGNLSVQEMLEIAQSHWGKICYEVCQEPNAPHEAKLLMLDSAKARAVLGWKPIWDHRESIARTIEWYRGFYDRGEVLSQQQLGEYMQLIKERV